MTYIPISLKLKTEQFDRNIRGWYTQSTHRRVRLFHFLKQTGHFFWKKKKTYHNELENCRVYGIRKNIFLLYTVSNKPEAWKVFIILTKINIIREYMSLVCFAHFHITLTPTRNINVVCVRNVVIVRHVDRWALLKCMVMCTCQTGLHASKCTHLRQYCTAESCYNDAYKNILTCSFV